ncbi:MAG TPA: glycosyltransferase family 87 protein [Solirubrobacteraceae bacterium]|nr:glycosyltransferase family 87 protein [Solirubrobacteraceae bacterium]
MREETGPSDVPVALASGTVGGIAPPSVGAPVAVPEPRRRVRRRLPGLDLTLGPRAGAVAIGILLAGTLAIVADAAAGPSILVPHTAQNFSGWEAGPLHLLLNWSIGNPRTVGYAFSVVLLVMIIAYLAVLAAARSLSMRVIAGAVVALHLILLLTPPMQLTDIFNYLGYARLGALHHLNPYRHVIDQEMFDPVYGYATWHNLSSPYGPLFTALTYPLAFVSVPIAYWAIKVGTILSSLAFLAVVWQCARQLGRDPRFVVAFVALNPIFLIYEVGAFHNDFFMLLPMMGAISLVLARHDRSAGALLMLGVAVKFTAIVLLPFLLLAALTRPRRVQLLIGAAAGTVVMAALSISLFGLSLPNLSDQSTLLTGTSISNLVGLILHVGGATPLLLKLLDVGVVAVVAHQFLRNRDWMAGTGWATVALIASLSWLMPWYVVWLLPIAALVSGRRLRVVSIALTIYLILAFMNWTSYYFTDNGVNLLNTHAGRASASLQNKLAN